MGPWGPLGLFRSYFEWKAIPNGRLLRMEKHSEMKANLEFANNFGVIPKPFRMESNFEWRVITKRNQLRNESSGKESHSKVVQNGCKTNERPFGVMAWGPLGLLRSHSEWKA